MTSHHKNLCKVNSVSEKYINIYIFSFNCLYNIFISLLWVLYLKPKNGEYFVQSYKMYSHCEWWVIVVFALSDVGNIRWDDMSRGSGACVPTCLSSCGCGCGCGSASSCAAPASTSGTRAAAGSTTGTCNHTQINILSMSTSACYTAALLYMHMINHKKCIYENTNKASGTNPWPIRYLNQIHYHFAKHWLLKKLALWP